MTTYNGFIMIDYNGFITMDYILDGNGLQWIQTDHCR